MKILQVNCVYKKGSTGKIVADIHLVLQHQGIDSIVSYGRGNILQDTNVYKFCSEFESHIHHLAHRYFGALMYGGCFISTNKLIRLIKQENPDVVHLHCINGYCVNIYKLLRFLAKRRIKTLVTNHAEFFYTGNCGHAYDCLNFQNLNGCENCPRPREATDSRNICRTATAWKKMHDAFAHFQKEDILFTAVSPWVKERLNLSPITNKFNSIVIENGLETNIFHPRNKDICSAVRKKNGIPLNSKMVFHATAFFNVSDMSLKGGKYIYQLAKRMPDVYFVVAALQYDLLEDCPTNLLLIGAAETQDSLAGLYSAADLTVITSRRETFSMITAESQCCGTPVVGFKAGGPESIAVPAFSEFVEYGNIEVLHQTVLQWLQRDIDKTKLAQEALNKFSKETMTEGYISAYKSILKS